MRVISLISCVSLIVVSARVCAAPIVTNEVVFTMPMTSTARGMTLNVSYEQKQDVELLNQVARDAVNGSDYPPSERDTDKTLVDGSSQSVEDMVKDDLPASDPAVKTAEIVSAKAAALLSASGNEINRSGNVDTMSKVNTDTASWISYQVGAFMTEEAAKKNAAAMTSTLSSVSPTVTIRKIDSHYKVFVACESEVKLLEAMRREGVDGFRSVLP